MQVTDDLFAGYAEQQEAFDHVARAVLVVDVDDIMTALEFLCGGYLAIMLLPQPGSPCRSLTAPR